MHKKAPTKLDDRERESAQTMIAGALHMHDAKRGQQSANSPGAVRAAATAVPAAKGKRVKAAAR